MRPKLHANIHPKLGLSELFCKASKHFGLRDVDVDILLSAMIIARSLLQERTF